MGGLDQGSVRISNLPSYIDIAAPYSCNYTLDLADAGEQGHPGVIDEEEAALPSTSYHDAYGNQISFEEYNRLCDLENEHEAAGTLHLLYPDLYPAPRETRDESIDLSVYVDSACNSERLVQIFEKDLCYNTDNGAGIFLTSLPSNCEVSVYTELDCQGTPLLAIRNGATSGCHDSGDFSSVLVTC